MATITVTQVTGERFRAEVRGHEVWLDQPKRDGVEAGPSPVELFVTSLAACVGHYGVGFLHRHGLPYDGLRVDCDWMLRAAHPARVSRVRMQVTPPVAVPAELRDAFHEAMRHCTVHNSLLDPPPVTIAVAEEPAGHPEQGQLVG